MKKQAHDIKIKVENGADSRKECETQLFFC